MTDLKDIKAGKYELVAKVWERPLSKPGQPYDYERFTEGDIVELDDAEAKRLYSAGAVLKPGERQKAAAAAALDAYRASVALLPEETRQELGDALPDPPEPQQSVAPTDPDAPATSGRSARKAAEAAGS